MDAVPNLQQVKIFYYSIPLYGKEFCFGYLWVLVEVAMVTRFDC